MYLISYISKNWRSCLKLIHVAKTQVLGDISRNGHRHDFCLMYLTQCHVELLEKRIVWSCEIITRVDPENI